MNRSEKLGRWGEAVAADFLTRKGYTLLAHNLRTAHGEIDLLARQGETLVFVEVKTRSTLAFGYPEEAITPTKRAHLLAAAEACLAEHPEWQGNWRIDVIAIYRPDPARPPHIEHYENAIS